jgi:hypothetical protein
MGAVGSDDLFLWHYREKDNVTSVTETEWNYNAVTSHVKIGTGLWLVS